MRRLIYFILAFIIWVLMAWPFVDGKIDLQVTVAGFVVAFIVSILFHDILPKEHRVFISPVRVFWALVYVPVFFYYVIKANLDVVYMLLLSMLGEGRLTDEEGSLVDFRMSLIVMTTRPSVCSM